MAVNAARHKRRLARLHDILEKDLDDHLLKIDRYIQGDHDNPYTPDEASEEFIDLAQRSKVNFLKLVVNTPCQALYVDGFRPGRELGENETPQDLPEWKHFEGSQLASRQLAIHRAAVGYGHAFTATEMQRGRVKTRGLSPLKTSALFEDPANDIVPICAQTILRTPSWEDEKEVPGKGIYWDEDGNRYKYTYNTKGEFTLGKPEPTGVRDECVVTRFPAEVDLDGRTHGVVEQMIPAQDRMNQSNFDLLVVQSGGAFTTKTMSGMVPPIKRDPETGEPELDENGQPQPLPVAVHVKKILASENPDTKFGTLEGTPLEGYVTAIEMALRHFAAASQTPPHYLLGQIANLSADALKAAETTASRKVAEFRVTFGESWERVFTLAGKMSGSAEAGDDEAGEVLWRDMEASAMGQVGDALGKFRENLDIPAEGLWSRVPGVTQGEITEWKRLKKEEDATLATMGKVRDVITGEVVDLDSMDEPEDPEDAA